MNTKETPRVGGKYQRTASIALPGDVFYPHKPDLTAFSKGCTPQSARRHLAKGCPQTDAPTSKMADDGAPDSQLTDHMIAGSLSGIVEHASVFPIDTVKTHIQASAEGGAASRSAVAVTRNLVRQHGVGHLYRGISALLPAIGPAHALMFSGYEQVLHLGGAREAGTTAWSKCSLASAPARLLCLLRARLAALGASTLPGERYRAH